jgi:spore germination protein
MDRGKFAVSLKAIPLLLIVIALAGCWDRNEIEEAGIVLGVGIDLVEPEAEGKLPRIGMLHQIALPSPFSQSASSKVQKDYINYYSEGPLVFDIIRNLSTRTSRPPSYEHLRIIVIGEEAARGIDLDKLINFFLRNTETRRSIRVVIAEGKARAVFEKPKNIKNQSMELRELTGNYRQTLRMPVDVTLGNMSERITGKRSFVAQRVLSLPGGLQLMGGAVISGRKARLVGWLDELETVGLNWMLGNDNSNGVVESLEPQSGAMLGYEVRSMTRRLQPLVEGDRISFRLDIKTTGKLREDWANPGDAFELDFIKRAEKAIAEEIKRLAEKALERTQHQFKVDAAGFGQRLGITHPALWKRVKDGWEERFSRMSVEIRVVAAIQEFGTRGAKQR